MTEQNSQPTEVPKGYLSLAEIAEKHPDWAKRVERATASGYDAGHDRKDGQRVMVFLNEPAPLQAQLWSNVSKDGNIKVEEIPNQKEHSMLAMDVLFLIGDPTLRFDLLEPKDDSNVNPQYHVNTRGQLLDYCHRRNSRKHHFKDQRTAYYKDKTVQEINDKYELWDKLPDFRVAIESNVTETTTAKKTMNERVFEAMRACEIPVTGKVFTTEQVHAVKRDLMSDAHIYGYGEALQGKHSDEHIRLYMKDAVEEYGQKE